MNNTIFPFDPGASGVTFGAPPFTFSLGFTCFPFLLEFWPSACFGFLACLSWICSPLVFFFLSDFGVLSRTGEGCGFLGVGGGAVSGGVTIRVAVDSSSGTSASGNGSGFGFGFLSDLCCTA